MSWRKLLPRPRWLPRAALMHPQRVVIAGFSLAMLLMFIVGGRDLYLLRERVLSSRQHELTLRALGGEAVFSAERSKLIFVRDYAQQLITLYDTGAAPADPAVERAFAQRNEPVWQMEVPLGDAPVVGAAPALLKGLEGFDRRDADLHADLYAARQLSHVLGLSLRLRDGDDPAGTVSYISSNGLYVTYPRWRRTRRRPSLSASAISRITAMCCPSAMRPGRFAGRASTRNSKAPSFAPR
ncbi:hypothetical protein [Cupriavidus sp. EM10]|uniref:hypothetical protein n=1 Tax=Cupriavidus sp. EM10 TaxID=2839983 RepID=UPI001CED1F69|nr:hypothetical protein [Cupriavidus sp. EM10]